MRSAVNIEPDLPHELKSFEAQLAALAPAGNLSRDELMYRAGWEACASGARQSAKVRQHRIHSWLWPASTAALVLLSVTLGLIVAIREPGVEVVYIEKSSSADAATANDGGMADSSSIATADAFNATRKPPSPGNDYFALREHVLAFGADVLPATTAPTSHLRTEHDARYGAMLGLLRGG